MRVCVIGTRGFPLIEGGVEKHCESLYPLIARSEDIEIIVFRRRSYVSQTPNYPNIKFVDLPSTKIKGLEPLMHSFLSTIKAIKMNADVVHFHNIGPALFSPLVKMFSIPVVLTYHSPNYEHKKWGPIAKRFIKFCEKIAFRFSDKIIFVNSFQMEKSPSKILHRSVYIPNGINKMGNTQNRDYLDEIGVQSEKYILSVGRITPEKGFDTLINAYKKSGIKDYKLVIAGGVEFENEYMNHLDEISKGYPVIFTGYVFGEKLAQLYSNAGLFVLASNNEGFPLVLLEAMNNNLDVVVSDISATHLVRLDSTDYFPKGDCEKLSEIMQEKLAKPRKREYDLSQFNWEQVSQEVFRILKEVAK